MPGCQGPAASTPGVAVPMPFSTVPCAGMIVILCLAPHALRRRTARVAAAKPAAWFAPRRSSRVCAGARVDGTVARAGLRGRARERADIGAGHRSHHQTPREVVDSQGATNAAFGTL